MAVTVTILTDNGRGKYLKVQNGRENNRYETNERGVVVMGGLSAQDRQTIYVEGKRVIDSEYPSVPDRDYPEDGELFAKY